MSSQRSNSVERFESLVEDGHETLDAEEDLASGQYDPDSVRTHVTETQFAENYGLEMDHLSQRAKDYLSESEVEEISLLQHKDSLGAVTRPAPPAGPRITRPDVQHEDPAGFAFGTPPDMTALRLGRNMGQGKASMLRPETSSAPTPLYSGPRLPANPRAVESDKTMPDRLTSTTSHNKQTTIKELCQRQDQAQQKNVSRDQPSKSVIQSTAATSISMQASLANFFQPSEPGADSADRNIALKQTMSPHPGTTQKHASDTGVSDILPVWPGTAQAQTPLGPRPEKQQPDSSRVLQSRPRSDSVRPPSSNTRGHPAMRPDPPRLAEPQVTSRIKSKVTKARRKLKPPKEASASATPAQSNETDNIPSQEDLLTILLFKTRQEKRNRDAAKALLQAKEAELERVQQASEVLRTQVEELSHRANAQREELAKHQRVLPALKIKARKLTDFVAGLTTDHNNLRNNAEAIQQKQEELIKEQSDVKTVIVEARKALECRDTDTAKKLGEARAYIAKLEQQVEDQRHQDGDTTSQLEAEQERSGRLEQEIFNISGIQREMVELLRGLRQATAEKLDEILTQPPPTISISDEGQKQANNILDRCSEILAEIKAAQSARPEDLRRLDNSVSDYAEKLNGSFLHLIEISKQCRTDQLNFKSKIQKQFEELTTSIKVEQSLSAQVVDLREVKATLSERAHTSETALAEARQMVVGLQGREQLLIQEISGLKAEVSTLRNRPREDPEAHARLRQTEALNTEMQVKIARLLSDTSEYTEKLNQNSEVMTGLQDRISGLESQLAEVKAANILLEKQKSECEAQAHTKYENFKSQLLEAANAERAILTEEQSKISQQMQRKKEAAESKAKVLDEELGKLKAVQANEAERSNQVQVESEGLRAQISKEGEELAQLRDKLRLTEEDLLSKRAENQLLEEANVNKGRQLGEAEARLAKSISESKSQEEERLQRVNHALQSFAGSSESHTNIDEAMEAILRSWEESQKRLSQDPMLDDLISSQDLLHDHEALELGASVDRNLEAPQEIIYGQNINVYPDKGSPVIPRIHSQRHEAQPKTQKTQGTSKEVKQNNTGTFSQRSVNRDDLFIEESQMEETMIRRNLTTTRSSRGGDGSIMPFQTFQTPSRRSQPAFSQSNDEERLFSPESPNFDTQDLFPPTPVPTSKIGNTIRPSTVIEHMQNRHASSSRTDRGEALSRSGTSQSVLVPTVNGNGATRNTFAPRGILKRPLKRRLGSEYGLTPGERTSKRQPSAVEKQGLGPIIPDSQQSPTTSANTQKPRKSRRVSQAHGQGHDKFTRRFSGLE